MYGILNTPSSINRDYMLREIYHIRKVREKPLCAFVILVYK
jgi:hypothetical protein